MAQQSSADVVSAFTEDQVARLTNITVHRLRYWDRTRFFAPEYAAENRRIPYSRIYSFKDIAALRVLSVLINQHNVPLRHLREVSRKLDRMDNTAWSRTTLYVLNRRVIFDDPEDGQPREVVSGQYMIGIPLEKVVSDTRRDIKKLSIRTKEQIGRITQHRRISHNAEVIAGTRIPVKNVKAFHDAGYSTEQIINEYPTLTEEDVRKAIGNRKAA